VFFTPLLPRFNCECHHVLVNSCQYENKKKEEQNSHIIMPYLWGSARI